MKKMTYEAFESLRDELDGTPNMDASGFYREFRFNRLGIDYRIVFFSNISTLYINDCRILFSHFSIDGCWPNEFKLNLNLIKNTDTVAVVPLEEY